jgi:hypothetical protein
VKTKGTKRVVASKRARPCGTRKKKRKRRRSGVKQGGFRCLDELGVLGIRRSMKVRYDVRHGVKHVPKHVPAETEMFRGWEANAAFCII